MDSADPSDQHKVAEVRVGNSVKFIQNMEEIETTADGKSSGDAGPGKAVQARLGRQDWKKIEFSAKAWGAILSEAIQLRDKFRARTVDSSDSTRGPETDEALRRDAEARETAWRAEMLAKFRGEKASPDFIYAFEKTGNLVTSENRHDWSAKELKEWDRLLQEYHRRTAMEGRVIDLCFRLHHESGRSAIGRHRRFAASEFGIRMLVFNEHEDERVFHILDKYWEQVHATFQIRMAGYSGLRVQ